MVVLNLNFGYDQVYNLEKFKKIVSQQITNNIRFVDASAALCRGLKNNDEYVGRYAHLREGVVYDLHPNQAASRIIAAELLNALKTN